MLINEYFQMDLLDIVDEGGGVADVGTGRRMARQKPYRIDVV
jgi:hypothetical protein